MPEMVFGLRGGRMFHVDEVDRGLACDCTCPKCGMRLVAKQGEINAYHFAHESDSDCVGAVESSLHRVAKQVLETARRMFVPPFFVGYHVGTQGQIVTFDRVLVETKYHDIIPDLLVYKQMRPLILEIKVHHAVNSEKKAKIQRIGTSALEIDLSRSDITGIAQLAETLIDGKDGKTWIFNAHEPALKKRVEIIRRTKRLPAWWYDCDVHTWHCPESPFGHQKACTDCDHMLEYIQNNQTGSNYRRNPDYVVCDLVK